MPDRLLPINGNKLGAGGVLAVLCAVVAVGVWVAGKTAGREAGEAAASQIAGQARLSERRFFTKVCERNNIVKAEARIAVHENKASPPSLIHRRDKLFVILDCESTFLHGGRGVPLTPGEDQKYLNIIRQARVPDLRYGRVIGSHEPEQGGLADF